MADNNYLGAELQQLENRDWELWSLALILMTVFAAGLIILVYADGLVQSALSPTVGRFVGLLLLSLIALVILLNIYLMDKRRSLKQLRYNFLQQEVELKTQREQANTDPLTEVYNRRYFDEIMPRERKRAIRQEYGLAILFVDVDDFRQVNNKKGHLQGDRALQEVAHILQKAVRVTDYVFRMGGDEFLIVLIATKAEGPGIVEHRVHLLLAASSDLQQQLGFSLTVSIGFAIHEADQTLEDLVERSEANLQAVRAEKKAHPSAGPISPYSSPSKQGT